MGDSFFYIIAQSIVRFMPFRELEKALYYIYTTHADPYFEKGTTGKLDSIYLLYQLRSPPYQIS